ncbi:MAG TPA: hypothetical protein VJ939_09840 [Bacteroidales bacterium]|nr:hypothetical protein [Bacteroidales bacterium]
MKIIPVTDKKSAQRFHDVARIIYKDNPVWICPLDKSIEEIFHSETNVFFKHGDAIRWILEDDQGELIGRVAAFINEKKAYNFDQPTGGMGFFECVEDRDAAFLLFDTARKWLEERGMKAMDGPINFGENDNFWGLLVDGFENAPAFGMNYHQPYYKDYFEAYGFETYFEQVTNHLNLKKAFPERFWKIAEWVMRKPQLTFKHFEYKKADKFIDDLKEVYDEAWKYHENFTPINKDDIYHSLEEAKPILEEEFVWYVYYDDEPIAFFIMFPDFNQILQHFNGKINWWHIPRFLWLKNSGTMNRARVTIMGVKPKFQRMGIESGIFWHLNEVMKKKPHYKELELSWVGDFNPKMQSIHQAVNSEFGKKHITYRKVFDKGKSAGRATTIAKDTKDREMKKKE